MKKVIVIIGSIPRDGIKPETVQEFNKAEGLLKAKGFYPVNPFSRNYIIPCLGIFSLTDNEQILDLSEVQYDILLSAIFCSLRLCDSVYLLDNYADDPIGYALLAMAHALGRKIYRSDRFFSPYSDRNLTLSFDGRSRTYMAHRLPERCET